VERSLEWHVVENDLGGRYRIWTDREIGMSQWLEFPVKDEQSWEGFKKWLNPDQPSRYPEYWDDVVRCYKGRDYPLGIAAGSYYGWLRDWVGMENLALWYYDRPDLLRDIVGYVADFVIRWTARALEDIPDIDFASIWEDMCMKTGPLISPELYRTFHLEPMKRVLKVLRQAGVKLITLDSDGMVDELLPLWMEAGIDVIYPIERASGCDPVRYRTQHGKKLRMYGGMDKRVLRDGTPRKAIEEEVSRTAPLIREGGYVPIVDHAIPPDVPLENYRYYRGLVNEACRLG
jgi:uroporphyrinogen decarboxylase